ncbi:MAG TPA: MBL fold metallo-hydrolase [Bacilli bacterium]|nr:MBL fold metallo-hydrolase [Bacilli bacterium]
MKRFKYSLVLLLTVITGCSHNQSYSSQSSFDTTGTSDSGDYSEESSSSNESSSLSSEDINDAFNNRISTMVSTGMFPRENDALLPALTAYDENAVLGSAAHPLLNQIDSSYLEIVAFEQPSQYGDAFLIKADNAEIIVDFGNYASTNYDDGTKYGSYLAEQYNQYITDQKLELMIVSHPHSDHIGGVDGFIDSNVNKIDMLVDYGYRGYNDSNYYNSIRNSINQWDGVYHSIYDCVNNLHNALERTYVTPELFIDWIDSGFYQSNSELDSSNLTYQGQAIEDLNITSVQAILNYRNFSFYLSGDMQNSTSYGVIDGENIMVENNQNNSSFHQVTMLKVGHHGSGTATYASLLEYLQPELGVISAGRVEGTNTYGNKFGACSNHPHVATLNRLKAANVKTYLNSASGTLHFVTNGEINSPVYFIGSPLKSSLYGGQNNHSEVLNAPTGSNYDISNDLWSSSFYSACHI